MADDLQEHAPGAQSEPRRRVRAVAAAALIAIAGWTVIAWNHTAALGEARLSALIDKDRAAVTQDANAISYNIGRNIAYLYGMPAAVADERAVVEVLASFGPDAERSSLAQRQRAEAWLSRADLMALNRHLALVNNELGSDVIFVMNASGDCVAASNYDTEVSLVGGNFVDREYFQRTRAGARGKQYAMGRITNIPGLFFSAPVMSDGRFVGSVVAKIDVPRLSHWVEQANAFVVDADGVVILARDKAIELRAIEGAPIFMRDVETRQAKYKRRDFVPMRFTPVADRGHPGLVKWDGADVPYLMARRELQGDDAAVHVLSRLDAIGEVARDQRSAFALLAFSGIAAILLAAGGAAYLARTRQHRRSMEQANAALQTLNAQLGELAATDPLTGCANRRQFLQKLAQEMARATRHKGALSVIALDLDHFKVINDTHGHAAGDEALRHFATLGRRLLRTQDTLARIGGEEFAILLPDTKEGGAANFAERLRAEVERVPVTYGEHRIPMKVSAGVVEWGQTAEAPEELMKRSDEALYAAKRGGRNRVVIGSAQPVADRAAGL